MTEYLDALTRQPGAYYLAVGLTLLLIWESVYRMKELRWGYAALVYATIGLWYLIDPVYREEAYQYLNPAEMSQAYFQVIIFLIAFRFLMPYLTPDTPSRVLSAFDPKILSNGRVATIVFFAWVVLFVIGISRMKFDVISALFPVNARSSWSAQLWARPRLGGSTDFLISAMGYLYEFVCSLFGLIAVGTKNPRLRRWMIFMMLLTWPGFVLGGARHKIISVAMPSILAILIVKKWTRGQQIAFLTCCFLAMNSVLLLILQYRNAGIGKLFEQDPSFVVDANNKKHMGLNMTEELVLLNRYQASGQIPVEWGYNYFANAVNVVPRSLWPTKPAVGQKFAELRVGFYRGDIAATISNGIVGQGVANFGKWLGPIAPAVLMSLLCGWICSFMRRGDLFLRACVVMICLGTLPNFGRDITFLPLWPVIFGAIGVIIYERQTRLRPTRRAYSVEPPIPRPPRTRLRDETAS